MKKLKDRIPWQRLFMQGAMIVTSILTAFTVDTWWEGKQNAVTERKHLEALERDFKIAKARADSSLQVALSCKEDVFTLFMAIQRGTSDKLGRSAFTMMIKAIEYEVFSIPTGAYDAMVSAGEVKILRNRALKQSMADFYGGFEDTRVTEAQLLKVVFAFQTSEVFAQKINWAEIGYSTMFPDEPLGERLKALVASWTGDKEIYNWLCLLMAHQDAVSEDYVFLGERIDQILINLADELD